LGSKAQDSSQILATITVHALIPMYGLEKLFERQASPMWTDD